MEPTFFGDSEQPLFGIYHPPIKQVQNESAILICYPLFQEYTRSHRALKQLADKLSQSGNHVFRFDYLGTGDSAGDLTGSSIGTWVENIKTATEELKDLSGLNKISIVAVRFSAILALQSIDQSVEDITLWDPIISGKQFIDNLSDMNKEILVDDDRFAVKRISVKTKGFTEILGYMIPDSLISDLYKKNLEISSTNIHVIKNVLFSNKNYNDGCFNEYNTNVQMFDEDCEWNDFHQIEDAIISPNITKSIVDLFK